MKPVEDKDRGYHEIWCDCVNKLSSICNCIVSGYIDTIEELERKLAKADAENNKYKSLVKTFDGEEAMDLWLDTEMQNVKLKEKLAKAILALDRVNNRPWVHSNPDCVVTYVRETLAELEEKPE